VGGVSDEETGAAMMGPSTRETLGWMMVFLLLAATFFVAIVAQGAG